MTNVALEIWLKPTDSIVRLTIRRWQKCIKSQRKRYSDMLDARRRVLPDDKLYQALRQI